MSNDSLIGTQLGNFQIERILGKGGMGQVYYGQDVKLNRPVAVKVIGASFRNDPAYAKRFVHEAQAVATWRHENIAQVYYADEQDDLYFFAMEYIDGMDLGEVLLQYAQKDERMPQAEVVRIGRAIADALDYAHDKDVIHRDVKPQNVLVAQDGRVVLTDFGLALDTQQGSVGEVFGTAHYIAPEQARRSSEAVPQSDLYSLGIMLYEMLTGKVPFDDPSPTAVALQHIMEPPPPPRSLNPALNQQTEAVLLKALAKTPQERYQRGSLLMDALENALQGNAAPLTAIPQPPKGFITTPALSPSHPAPGQKKKGGIPWLLLGGCLLALMLGAVLVVGGLLVLNPLAALQTTNPPPTDTPINVDTIAPTQGHSAEATDSPAHPATETLTSRPPSPTGTPTVQFPNGKRFMLFYDDNSLYFLNLSESDIPINWVAFERLDDSGAASDRFNGSRWGEFYATSTPGWCMALQILDRSPYLAPPDCGHSNRYLSLRTPVHNDSTVFWTAQDGSHQFRVLWREDAKDIEVARCEISAGTCEVFFP